MRVLVTGGAGYIGSHTLVELLNEGYDVVVLDNLVNSSVVSIGRVKELTNKTLDFIQGDITDSSLLNSIFNKFSIDAVIHFAGLKSVSESIEEPIKYYANNVLGTQVLLDAMSRAGVYSLIFSSSATVYGNPAEIPISEACPTGQPTNPYGRSKLMIEQILEDIARSDERWKIALLRYFNPIGAHKSGLIGENPNGIPNNLLPYLTQVAVGERSFLPVYGDGYNTKDGTGVRDYIHVVDLARGHISALSYVRNHSGAHVWNLGTGKGYSVLDVINTFYLVNNIKINYHILEARDGDIDSCYAAPQKAYAELGWKAYYDLNDMLMDAWKWQKMNPNGYD